MSKEFGPLVRPTDVQGQKSDFIPFVLYNLGELEYGKKPLPAQEELAARLQELADGRIVPLVVFNCLDFTWIPAGAKYPKSIVSGDASTSICRYSQDAIEIIRLDLETLGNPNLQIVVPDSELFDDRVFSFAQPKEEREIIAATVKSELSEVLAELNRPNNPVTLWSEYCQSQGLLSPQSYTTANYERLQRDPQLQRRVREQVRDSKRYFEKNGIFSQYLQKVREEDLFDRTTWYLAMYMGEGQALHDSGAIVINLEDRRVPTWFQRGANGELPIITPVDSAEFYRWRRTINSE